MTSLQIVNQRLLLILVLWVNTSPCSTIHSSRFVLSDHCLSATCVPIKTSHVRSKSECASKCLRKNSCAGFQVDLNNTCVLHQQGCFLPSRCAHTDPNDEVYEKETIATRCQNNGTWDSTLNKCVCVSGWVGSQCERLPYACDELRTFGYPDDIYWAYVDIYRNQSLLPLTRCRLSWKEVRTFIFQNAGDSNHNKTWPEYEQGYRIRSFSYWLGLENMLAFNRQGHNNLMIYVKMKSAVNNTLILWRHHENFQMRDTNSGYSFTFQSTNVGWSGVNKQNLTYEIGDILGPIQNLPFFTVDRDNAGLCALQAGAGWWFPDCSNGMTSNLLGRAGESGYARLRVLGLDLSNPGQQFSFQNVGMYFVKTA